MKNILVITALFLSLLGCKSDIYQKSQHLTLNSDNNKGFTNENIYQEYSCAPDSIAIKTDGTVEVSWGNDPSEECGEREQKYSIEFRGNDKYRVATSNQVQYVKVIELDDHIYGAKKLGYNPFIIYTTTE